MPDSKVVLFSFKKILFVSITNLVYKSWDVTGQWRSGQTQRGKMVPDAVNQSNGSDRGQGS
jgi:hypothetical protein